MTRSHTVSLGKEWYVVLDPHAIRREHGPSVFSSSERRLRENVEAYANLVSVKGIRVAVKPAPILEIWKLLACFGCGADCCSQEELDLVVHARVPMSLVSLYMPGCPLGPDWEPDLTQYLYGYWRGEVRSFWMTSGS